MARKLGSREYRGDNKLCVEMARLILRGEARSAWEAAQQLAPRAGQRDYGTSLDQRTRRLYDLYRDQEPTWIAWGRKGLEPPRGSLATFIRAMQTMRAQASWFQWRARRKN